MRSKAGFLRETGRAGLGKFMQRKEEEKGGKLPVGCLACLARLGPASSCPFQKGNSQPPLPAHSLGWLIWVALDTHSHLSWGLRLPMPHPDSPGEACLGDPNIWGPFGLSLGVYLGFLWPAGGLVYHE